MGDLESSGVIGMRRRWLLQYGATIGDVQTREGVRSGKVKKGLYTKENNVISMPNALRQRCFDGKKIKKV